MHSARSWPVASRTAGNSLLAIRIRRERGAAVPSAGEEKQNRYVQPLAILFEWFESLRKLDGAERRDNDSAITFRSKRGEKLNNWNIAA
jgi:hypothetical protein